MPSVIPLALSAAGFDLIAEVKLRGPASGRLAPAGDDLARVVAMAIEFARGGAAAISVLTEPEVFDGSLTHLAGVAAAVNIPVMRKDFLVSPEQVVEAREHGASGVLIITRILGRSLLVEMVDATLELGMFPLVEVFDQTDLETASTVLDRPVLLGVNCRDLTDLSVEFDRFRRLAPLVPPGLVLVAESGIEGPDDVAAVAGLGYRMGLVGTSLSTTDDPARLVAGLVAAGRQAVRSRAR